MLRPVLILITVAMCSIAAPAKADWLCDLFGRYCHEFEQNKRWPEPFIYPDREIVGVPFATMISNGWRAQNTLADHHFDHGTGHLTESGRLKVRDIMTLPPPEFRTVFVLRPDDPALLASRIESVREVASRYAFDGSMPEVVETTIHPRGWSANYVDTIGRKFNETTPAPRIPQVQRTEEEL